MQRLYVVTRSDLPPGVQACQALHAAVDFTYQHPRIADEWHASSNTIAVLAAADEPELWRLLDSATDRGYAVTAFHEPDRGGELTAVAVEPAGRRLVARFPLALNDASTDRREQ